MSRTDVSRKYLLFPAILRITAVSKCYDPRNVEYGFSVNFGTKTCKKNVFQANNEPCHALTGIALPVTNHKILFFSYNNHIF